MGIPDFGDGKPMEAGLCSENDNPFSSKGEFFAFPAWLYVN